MPRLSKGTSIKDVEIGAEYGYTLSSYGDASEALLVRAVAIDTLPETHRYGRDRDQPTGRNVRRVRLARLEGENDGEEFHGEAKHLRYSAEYVRERRQSLAAASAARTKLAAAFRLRSLDDKTIADPSTWSSSIDQIDIDLDPETAVRLAEILVEGAPAP